MSIDRLMQLLDQNNFSTSCCEADDHVHLHSTRENLFDEARRLLNYLRDYHNIPFISPGDDDFTETSPCIDVAYDIVNEEAHLTLWNVYDNMLAPALEDG